MLLKFLNTLLGENMPARKIIIPSKSPGGLDATLCDHFGQCPTFTAVTIEKNSVSSVEVIPNTKLGCRNCYDPIRYLWEKGMNDLIVYKLGVFPLRILESLGVPVFYAGGTMTIKEAVESYLQGHLKAFSAYDTCSGECEHDA
jgi:predicted Fe-Mo cluster-binding NifX family protein